MGCCGNKSGGSIVLPTVKQVGKGVVGLSKVIFQPKQLTDAMITERRAICKECSESVKDPLFGITALSQCRLCACVIKLKTMSATEECPMGKWKAVNQGKGVRERT